MKKLVSLLSLILLFSMSIIKPKAGDRDPTFGLDGTGIVTQDIGIGLTDQARGVAIQQDGKIVVVGDSSNDSVFVRYNPDGTLDNTFNPNGPTPGIRVINVGGVDRLFAVALQEDGKIVGVGDASDNWLIIRLNPDGSNDLSFNGTGFRIIMPIAGNNVLDTVAIQADGKIVAGGQSGFGDFTALRLNPNGTSDTSFGNDGIASISTSLGADILRGLAIQPCDGKIVAIGETPTGVGANTQGAVVRFNVNGTADTSFGNNGVVLLNTGGSVNGFYEAVIQPDGKIIAAGRGGNDNFSIARFNIDGSLDTTFNPTGSTPGLTIVDVGTLAFAFNVVLQPDGKIVAGGQGPDSNFALVRLTTDGEQDITFGDDGIVVTDVGNTAGADNETGLALTQDGRFILVGREDQSGGGSAFATIRYLGDTLTVTKEASTKNPCPGQDLYYTITVRNTGAAGGTVNEIYVEDLLPVGIAFLSAKLSGEESTFDPETGLWYIPHIRTCAYAQLKITARVGKCAGDQEFCNTAVTTFSSVDEVTDSSLFESLGISTTEIFSTTECISSLPVVYENTFDIIKRTDCNLSDLQEVVCEIQQQQEINSASIANINTNTQLLEQAIAKLNCLANFFSAFDCAL